MSFNIRSIIIGCLIKFTSITDKEKEHIITPEQSRDLATDLVRNATSEIHRHRVSSFVTDN